MKCIYCDRPNEGEHKHYCPARNSPLTIAESLLIMRVAKEYSEKYIKEREQVNRMFERTQEGKLSGTPEFHLRQTKITEFS